MAWKINGKTVLITGATSGIGLEAAIELTRLGAEVIAVGRDPVRTGAAAERIRAAAHRAPVTYLCDFAVQASIRRLAAQVLDAHPRLHVLVNNAGGVHKRRAVTVDGIERTFATNHLGYFLLTTLLLDRIVASVPARIVTVASIAHRQGTLDFDDIGYSRGYWVMRAYGRSKLANVLFANELARRLDGTGVTSNSLHPGRVATNIWTGAPLWTKPYIALFLRPTFLSAEQGAQTIVQLAASPDLEGVTGRYFEDQRAVEPALLAQDSGLASRLWAVSEAMVTRTPGPASPSAPTNSPDS